MDPKRNLKRVRECKHKNEVTPMAVEVNPKCLHRLNAAPHSLSLYILFHLNIKNSVDSNTLINKSQLPLQTLP